MFHPYSYPCGCHHHHSICMPIYYVFHSFAHVQVTARYKQNLHVFFQILPQFLTLLRVKDVPIRLTFLVEASKQKRMLSLGALPLACLLHNQFPRLCRAMVRRKKRLKYINAYLPQNTETCILCETRRKTNVCSASLFLLHRRRTCAKTTAPKSQCCSCQLTTLLLLLHSQCTGNRLQSHKPPPSPSLVII